MNSLFIVAAAALAVALVLTPLCRDVAIRLNLLDRPDHSRKIHRSPIPRIGGIAIVAAYVCSFAFLLLLSSKGGDVVRDYLGVVWKLFPAAAVAFATGLFDDLVGLKPWQKLLGQITAAALALRGGVSFSGIGHHHFPIWLAYLATIVWLVGCANAFNLIDGVDGLAAGIGFFATITTLIAALLRHDLPLALATAPLAGALLGFLRYNFNPATVFLGDCGSLLIGFLLGCYSLLWSAKSATVLGMTAPLLALSIPLLDTLLSIFRRFLRNKPIFLADRGHIHHKLLARGLTPRRVVLLIYVFCGISAGLSLLASVAREQIAGIVILLFCLGTWFCIQKLGYAEFEAAHRMVLAGTFRRLLNAELRLITFRDGLVAAATPEQCWEVLRHAYNEFGFNEIEVELGGSFYTDTINRELSARSWTIRIDLSETEYLKLSREFHTEAPPYVARFADVIGAILPSKVFARTSADGNAAYAVASGSVHS